VKKRKGRPKDIATPLMDRHDPGNYPTLLRYLEAKGKVRHISYVQMMQARHLFLRGGDSTYISEQLDGAIEPAIIDRWALMFSWDEERDRRLFEQFRKSSGTDKPYGGDLAKRHERIAGGIEQYAEKLLLDGQNGKEDIKARDLATLASTIKATQEIRRTARGEDIDRKENTVNVNLGIPASLERLAGAIVDFHEPTQLKALPTRTIAIGTEDILGSDEEFEKETTDGKSKTG